MLVELLSEFDSITGKTYTRRRTHHFSNINLRLALTYLQFPIRKLLVSFQFRSAFQLRSAISEADGLSFPSCDLELWPMTLTFERDSDSVEINQRTNIFVQRLFSSNIIVWTPHKRTPDRLL